MGKLCPSDPWLTKLSRQEKKTDQRFKAVGLQSHRAIDHEQETSQPAAVQDEKCHGPAEERTQDIKGSQEEGKDVTGL